MGIISGALGGLGESIQYQAQVGMQNDALEARDTRQTKLREELEAKRMETIEANKVKTDERNAAIYIKAADAAPAAGDERRFQKFKTDIGQTDATEDQLRTVFKNQYNQRQVGNFGGADRYVDPASANSQDIVGELRKNAAPATMIMSAQKDHQSQLAAERQATLDAFNGRKLDAKDRDAEEVMRSNKADEAGRAARTEAIIEAAEIRASKTATSAEKQEAVLNLNTIVSSQGKRAADAEEKLRLVSRGSDAEKALRAELTEAKDLVSQASKAIKGRLDAPSKDVPTPAKGKPAAVDTSSALIDAKRAIAKNPSNRAEVIRRLEAAGISTKGL
jgi:hypothetical protein